MQTIWKALLEDCFFVPRKHKSKHGSSGWKLSPLSKTAPKAALDQLIDFMLPNAPCGATTITGAIGKVALRHCPLVVQSLGPRKANSQGSLGKVHLVVVTLGGQHWLQLLYYDQANNAQRNELQ